MQRFWFTTTRSRDVTSGRAAMRDLQPDCEAALAGIAYRSAGTVGPSGDPQRDGCTKKGDLAGARTLWERRHVVSALEGQRS